MLDLVYFAASPLSCETPISVQQFICSQNQASEGLLQLDLSGTAFILSGSKLQAESEGGVAAAVRRLQAVAADQKGAVEELVAVFVSAMRAVGLLVRFVRCNSALISFLEVRVPHFLPLISTNTPVPSSMSPLISHANLNVSGDYGSSDLTSESVFLESTTKRP